jgi:hypothetical protein
VSDTAQLALIAMIGTLATGALAACSAIATAAIAAYVEARRSRIATEQGNATMNKIHTTINGDKAKLLAQIAALQIEIDSRPAPPPEKAS